MRTLKLALAALFLLAVLPSAASADDFYASTTAEITSQINAASTAPGDSTVHIAAGSYAITSTTFPMLGAGDRLDIVGAGVGQTIFSGTADSSGLIRLLLPTAASEMRGFTLNAEAVGNHQSGLVLTSGKVSNFEVVLTGAGGSNVAAIDDESGSEVSNGVVRTVAGQVGYKSFNGSPVIDNASFTANPTSAYPGMRFGGSTNATVSRVRTSGYQVGVSHGNGTLKISDSVIDMGGYTSARALFVRDQNTGSGSTINFTGERLTIVGTGTDQYGIETGTGFAADVNDVVNWSLLDTVIYSENLAHSVFCWGPLSIGIMGVLATNKAPNPAGGGCSYGSPTLVTIAASAFANFAAGNFRPAWNSNLVDAGTTTPTAPLDFAGNPRVVDGDNSGTPAVDLGAIEYQRGAPTVTINTPKLTLSPLEATTFTAVAEDPEGEALTYAWTFDGVASPLATSSHAGGFITPGPHTAAVTVTDEAGVSSTVQVVVQVVSSGPGGPGGSPLCPSKITDSIKVAAKPKKSFKRGSRGVAAAKSKAKQPFFSLMPNFPTAETSATLRFTLEAVGKKGKLKKLNGAQTIVVKRGTAKFTFGGKWNKKRLKAGKYRLTATPMVPATGCRQATSATVTLKLK